MKDNTTFLTNAHDSTHIAQKKQLTAAAVKRCGEEMTDTIFDVFQNLDEKMNVITTLQEKNKRLNQRIDEKDRLLQQVKGKTASKEPLLYLNKPASERKKPTDITANMNTAHVKQTKLLQHVERLTERNEAINRDIIQLRKNIHQSDDNGGGGGMSTRRSMGRNTSQQLSGEGIDGQTQQQQRDGCRKGCLLYTSPSPRDLSTSRMPSSA